MQKLNVLAVARDNSVLEKLGAVISTDASLHLSGQCSTGAAAMALAASARPDVIALDIELPGEDGCRLINSLSKICGAKIVAMSQVAGFALQALDAGAADFVYMPVGGSDSDIHRFAEDTVDRIKAASMHNSARIFSSPEADGRPVRLAVVACAGGGPVPLAYLLKHLRQDGPAVLIQQRNPAVFHEDAASLLSKLSGKQVEQGQDGIELAAGKVVLIGDRRPVRVEMIDGKVIMRFIRKSAAGMKNLVDVLFLSAAQELGVGAAGVLLSGDGDGYDGLMRLASCGAKAILRNKNALLREIGYRAPGGVAELSLEDIAAAMSSWVSPLPEPSSAATRCEE